MHNPQHSKDSGQPLWVCSYINDGKEYDVNLRGSTEDAVLNNNLQQYPGLVVHGVHISTTIDEGTE